MDPLKSDPYWWEDAGRPVVPEEIALPTDIDVLVIGAGLTGASAARTLAKAGKGVLVLDSEAPGIGASSRNGGLIGGGHRLSIAEMEARFGKDTANDLLREAHLESTSFAGTLMVEEGIDCDFKETGRFRGLWKASDYDAEARGLEKLQSRIPVEAEMIPRDRQRDILATDLYAGGIVYPRHGCLNPTKWVKGLLAAATRAGAIIQGNTPVDAVQKDGTGFKVRTARGMVRAGQVMMATNGYTPAHMAAYKRRIIPIPSFIVATEELGENRLKSLFPAGRVVSENRERHCYYRPSPDGKRLVFGGRAAMFNAPDRLVESQLKGLMTQIFPELSGVTLTQSWRGRTGFAFDFLPNVGRIEGVWHAMGYSGSGNTMAPYLGHKAALQILGDPEGETAFSKSAFPTRWWHRGQPWFLPFADVMFRARDVINNLRR